MRSLADHLQQQASSQYLEECPDRETLALKRLCAALIVRSIRDLDCSIKEIRRGAYYWIYMSINSKITFNDCCNLLGYNPSKLRTRIKGLKSLPKCRLTKLISPKGRVPPERVLSKGYKNN